MATSTNTAINSRSLNGVITITDGTATLENGDLNCNDINSDSINTASITTGLFTCNGEFRSNLVGPYTIPVSVSAEKGSLISYGNVSNSGATDFTNYGSTYNLLKQGFYFNNINSTQPLTNLAIIDNSQTYFKSQLVGCTAETPLSNTSIVNKSYVDNNFVDKTTSQTIAGIKNFTNNSQFRATLTYYDTQSPFTNNSQFFHIGVTSVIKNNANSGIITYNTRTFLGTASNVMEISSAFLRMFKPIRVMDTNPPLTGYTEIVQAGTLLSFTPSYNLGQYQFKTKTSTGMLNIPLIIDNDGISVFGTTSCAVMESSAYRGTSATADLAIGGTTTSGTILIGTVINGTLGGEIRIGTTLSTNNINGTTTFSNNCNFNSILTLKNKKQLNETQNIQTSTTITLSFPLQETTVIRSSGGATTITVVLPTVTVNEVGLIFNFFKFQTGLNVILQSASRIYTLNDLATGSTTNTTLLSSDKLTTTLMCNSFGTLYYWVEVSNYSTFDRDYNNTLYARLASPNAFTNTNTFNSFLPTSTLTPSSPTELTTKAYVDGMPVHQILNTNNIWTGTNTFNTYLPTSTLTPSSATDLITKSYADGKFIDFTTDQTVSALQKRFNGLFCTSFNITPTLGGSGNRQQLYVTGQELAFVALFTNNYYRFYCRDSLSNQTNPFEISSSTTIVRNNLVSNNLTSPTTTSTNNIYTNLIAGGIINLGSSLSTNTISGNTTFSSDITTQNIFCETALYLSDFIPLSSSYSSILVQNSDILNFDSNFTNNKFQFKVSTNPVLLIDGNNTTFSNNLVSNAQATFNTNAPISNVNASSNNHLTTLGFNDGRYIDFTSDQIISGTKRFNTISWTNSGNVFAASITGTFLNFSSFFNLNNYAFYTRDALSQSSISFQISSSSTIINNSLVSNAQATFNNFTPISSVASPTANNHLTRKDYVDGNFMNLSTAQAKSGTVNFLNQITFNGGSGGGTAIVCNNGLNANTVLNVAGQASFNGTSAFNNTATFATDVLFSADTINFNGTTSAQDLDFFTSITLGTIHLFSSLSNSLVSMFNYSTNDVTLEINAKVKFRQVKLYNQVKTITSNITLTFPLEETIVIRPTGVVYIELPLITANSLGMSFNFITNSTAHAIWFETQGTDNIIKNGYTTGNTSTIVLGTNGITSVQLTCLELSAGVYTWSFFSSLPERVSNPPGTIITMCVQSTPSGYLACDGGSYSFGGIYSNLYQVIGTTYGSNGLGTFRVPNFNNGSFLRGIGGNSAVIATQQQDNIKTHTHNTTFYRFDKGSSGGTNVISDLSSGNVGSTVVSSSTNIAGSPDETRPINYAVHYCIKY